MNKIEELKRLKSLLDQGAITETEYNNLISKIIDEKPDSSEYELKAVFESLQKLKISTKSLKNWGVVMAVLLIGVITAVGADNYTSIKHFIKGISGNTMTEDVIGNNDSTNTANKNIIYQDGKEIGRIVKQDFDNLIPQYNTADPMEIPNGKMWTPLYYEITNGRQSYPNVFIFPFKRGDHWSRNDMYKFEDTKDLFVSIKYAKQYYRPLALKVSPAVMIGAYPPASITLYFFEESIDY